MRTRNTYEDVRRHLEALVSVAGKCSDTTTLLAFVLVLLGKFGQAEKLLAHPSATTLSAGHLMLLLAYHKTPHKILPFLHP